MESTSCPWALWIQTLERSWGSLYLATTYSAMGLFKEDTSWCHDELCPPKLLPLTSSTKLKSTVCFKPRLQDSLLWRIPQASVVHSSCFFGVSHHYPHCYPSFLKIKTTKQHRLDWLLKKSVNEPMCLTAGKACEEDLDSNNVAPTGVALYGTVQTF